MTGDYFNNKVTNLFKKQHFDKNKILSKNLIKNDWSKKKLIY